MDVFKRLVKILYYQLLKFGYLWQNGVLENFILTHVTIFVAKINYLPIQVL